MQTRVLLGFALFVLMASAIIPAVRAIVDPADPVDPEPEEPLVCAYSTALGFNPWERFHVVGLDATSEIGGGAEIQGRIIASNLVVGGGGRVATNPGKTDQFKFALTSAGTFTDAGGASFYNGGIDAVGAVIFGSSNVLNGDINSQATVKVHQGARVNGNVNAVGAVTVEGNAGVVGNVHTNGGASITQSSKVTGSLIAGGSLTVSGAGMIIGSAACANDDGYDMATGTITGTLTVAATPPAMTIPFSTDFAAVKAYFEGRSAAWKEEADSVVHARVVEASSGYAEKRALHIRLHSKVNFYTVTREVLLYVQQIVLAGHPGGFLVLNVPGTGDIDMQYKRVFSSDKDGVESVPAFGRLLLNFYETTGRIKLGNIQTCQCSLPSSSMYSPVGMSILAPFATVASGSSTSSGASAYLKGNVIAKTVEFGSSSIIYTQPFGTMVRPLVPVPRPPAAPSVNSGKMEFLCMWHNL